MDKKNDKKAKAKKVKNSQTVNNCVNANFAPLTDPQGSYTGKPLNQNDTPTQDQDDL